MLQIFKNRVTQMLCLGIFGLFAIGCGSLLDGGGGTVDPTEPRFISGTFVSEQGKMFIFEDDGSYKYFASKEEKAANKPFLESRYEMKGFDIFLDRNTGEKFADPAKISEDGKTFTWIEHPGETFSKQEN